MRRAYAVRCAECIRYAVRTKKPQCRVHTLVFVLAEILFQLSFNKWKVIGRSTLVCVFICFSFLYVHFLHRSFVRSFVRRFLWWYAQAHGSQCRIFFWLLSTVVSCCLPRCIKATDINYQICQLLYCEQSLFIRVWSHFQVFSYLKPIKFAKEHQTWYNVCVNQTHFNWDRKFATH